MAKKKGKSKRGKSLKWQQCLSGVAGIKSPTLAKATDTGADVLGVTAGLLASALAGWGIDKVLKTDEVKTDTDGKTVFNIKKIVKPITLTVVGFGGSWLCQAHKGSDTPLMRFCRHAGYGFTTGGIISGGKLIFKKDLFAGLGKASSEEQKALQASYMRENAELLKKLSEANEFRAELPEPAKENEPAAMGNPNENEEEERELSIM